MEERGVYNRVPVKPESLQPFTRWHPPTGDEIKAALQMANWTGMEFARRLGFDGRTIRRWTGNEKTIPYAAWCVLCRQAGLGDIW